MAIDICNAIAFYQVRVPLVFHSQFLVLVVVVLMIELIQDHADAQIDRGWIFLMAFRLALVRWHGFSIHTSHRIEHTTTRGLRGQGRNNDLLCRTRRMFQGDPP